MDGKFDYWHLLTPEIKSECVKHLDFLTRIKFRTLSKKERLVVNSTKFDVVNLSITSGEYGEFLEMELKDEEKFKMMSEDEPVLMKQMVPLLAFILKCGVIDELECGIDDLPEPAINLFRESGQFRFKHLSGKCTSQTLLLLEQCAGNMVESVRLWAPNGQFLPFDRIMANESLRNVKLWDVKTVGEEDALSRMAHRWIDSDAEEGTELKIGVTPNSTAYEHLKETFQDRIEDEDLGHKIRIRINQEKHISLHCESVTKFRMFVHSARYRTPPPAPRPFRIE